MDTMKVFARGEASKDNKVMVFDWDKAARLIRKHKPRVAEAGLQADWEGTGGVIFENGKPVTDSYTYLASAWAAPQIELDGEAQDCFVMRSKTKWDSGTKWPKSALALLEGRA